MNPTTPDSIPASRFNDPEFLAKHLAEKKARADARRAERIARGEIEVTEQNPPAAEPTAGNKLESSVIRVNFDMYAIAPRLAADIAFKTPASFIKAMKDFQAKYERAQNRLWDINHAAVKSEYTKLGQIGAEMVMGDAPDSLTKSRFRFFSRRQLAENMKTERSAVKQGTAALSLKAAKLARPVVAEFVERLNDDIAEREDRERKEFAALDLKYEPRPLLSILRFVTSRIAVVVPDDDHIFSQAPKQFAPWLPI
jgi:hypothetical protein